MVGSRGRGDQILARMTPSLEMLGVYMSLARLLPFRVASPSRTRDRQAAEIAAVGPHRVWQLEDAIFLAYATGRDADGRSLMEAALSASPDPLTTRSCGGRSTSDRGEADHADAARRRRRALEVEEAIAAGRRFADVLRRSAQNAIDADGGGPMVRAELITADAEESRLEGRPDLATMGRGR